MHGIIVVHIFCFIHINHYILTKSYIMTQKEMQQLTICMSNGTAFIGKILKNGKPSDIKRELTEQECMAFVTWFIRTYCQKYGYNEFTIDINNVPTYKMGIIPQETSPEVNVEFKEA